MAPHEHAPNPEQMKGEALKQWQREQAEREAEHEEQNRLRRELNPSIQSEQPEVTKAFLNLQEQTPEEGAN